MPRSGVGWRLREGGRGSLWRGNEAGGCGECEYPQIQIERRELGPKNTRMEQLGDNPAVDTG
jgi:hypothetical protein